MGSLRTPVGPLPSSIYWRRRAVVLLLLALLVALVVWALSLGGGDGGGDGEDAGHDDNRAGGGGPAESITPGPTPSESESLIEERPGGREEPDDPGDPGEDATGGSGGAGTGTPGGVPTDDADQSIDDGGNGEAGGSTGDGGSVAGLPRCGASDVRLSLRSDENEYALGEEPELQVSVENVSGASCRVDFGHDALTITVTRTVEDADDERVWSSADCPADPASIPAAVPAGGGAEHAVDWDRRHSSDDCDGPAGEPAPAGTYVAEATLGDLPVARTSFRLDQD